MTTYEGGSKNAYQKHVAPFNRINGAVGLFYEHDVSEPSQGAKRGSDQDLPKLHQPYLELAKTYVEMKKWDLALKELEVVERLPQTHQDDLRHKQEARQLKAEIAKKSK